MVHSDRRQPDSAAALDAREEGTAPPADDLRHGRCICAHMDRPHSCGPPQRSRTSLWPLAASVVLLTTWSLYISSWCGSGIIALALLLPASAAAMALARWIDWIVSALVLPQHSAGAYGVLTQPSVVFTF